MITHFSTRRTDPANQLDMWNDVMAQTYSGLSASPLRPGFAAHISRWQLGPVVLTRPVSTPVAVERRHMTGRAPVHRTLKLHLFQSGGGRLLHRHREAELRQGDIVLCAGEENYRFDMAGDHELLIAEMDYAMLPGPTDWLDDIIGVPIRREYSGTRLIHDFLLSLWRESDAMQSSDAYGRLLADMVLTGLRPSAEAAPAVCAPLWQRAKAIIAARIGESDLTPASLAGELGVSLRKLQAEVAACGTTPGGYIIEKRLEVARQYLLTQPHRSITQIAFDCGFEDSGYFSRRFRRQYGINPAAFRMTHQ